MLERRTTTGEQGVSGEGKQLLGLLLFESTHLVFEQLAVQCTLAFVLYALELDALYQARISLGSDDAPDTTKHTAVTSDILEPNLPGCQSSLRRSEYGDQVRMTYGVCKVQESGRTLLSLVVDWVGDSRRGRSVHNTRCRGKRLREFLWAEKALGKKKGKE